MTRKPTTVGKDGWVLQHGAAPDMRPGHSILMFKGKVIYDSERDGPNPTHGGKPLFLHPDPKTTVYISSGHLVITRRERCKGALTPSDLRRIANK